MALCKPGPLIQSISGAVGSVVFANAAGKTLVRHRPTHRQSQSASTLQAHRTFLSSIRSFPELSDASRAAWRSAAQHISFPDRLGSSSSLSPIQLFSKSAIRASRAGLALPDTPLPENKVSTANTYSISISAGGPALITSTSPVSYNMPLFSIAAQRTHSSSGSLPGRLLRLVSTKELVNFQLDFWPDLCAVLGTPSPSEWLLISVTQWAPGWPRALQLFHRVQVSPSGPELIAGGNFENNTYPVPHFDVTGAGLLVTAFPVPTWDGRCVWWNVGNLPSETFWQTATADQFPLIGGATYTMSLAYAHLSGSTNLLSIGGIGMSTITVGSESVEPASDWTYGSFDFTPDGDAPYAWIRISSSANTPGSNLYDSISLRRIA